MVKESTVNLWIRFCFPRGYLLYYLYRVVHYIFLNKPLCVIYLVHCHYQLREELLWHIYIKFYCTTYHGHAVHVSGSLQDRQVVQATMAQVACTDLT